MKLETGCGSRPALPVMQQSQYKHLKLFSSMSVSVEREILGIVAQFPLGEPKDKGVSDIPKLLYILHKKVHNINLQTFCRADITVGVALAFHHDLAAVLILKDKQITR